MTPPQVVDVLVEGHGSLYLFLLHTDAARSWVDEHVSDDAQWLGEALVVEHRYAADLAVGMNADGLVVR